MKKNNATSAPQKTKRNPSPSSGVKHSLLSLEQRLMFDAAAAATASEVASEQVAQEQAEAAVSSDASHEPTDGEKRGSEDVAQVLATYMPTDGRVEVAFIDPTVPNYRELLLDMDPNIEVIMVDGGRDGIQQIASALEGRTGIDAIHIISHGSAGELNLGTGTLNTSTMSDRYANDLATIQHALSEQADVLVYGCDFAKGETGQQAVDMLAELTGADVEASTDLTGHISLDGDWDFEVKTGSIETHSAISNNVQMNWVGVLGTETVQDTFSKDSYSNNDGTQLWATSWSEKDANAGDVGGGDIRVNSGELSIGADSVGNAISRGVNLSGAGSATLTFDYINKLSSGDTIELRISTDGGATYKTMTDGSFSDTANTGSGTAKFDLSGFMSADTRIQFIVTGTGGSDQLYIDNAQVIYDTLPANNAPIITSNGGGATASITVVENKTAVTTVKATDADTRQTLTYAIAGGADAAKFTINRTTGALAFVTAPNYEAPTDTGKNNVYDVTVQVSDGKGGTDTQAIAVTVVNANERPTALTLTGTTVAENAATGTVVGTAAGTDPDAGDTKSYSLTNTAGGRFAIHATTGQLTVADGSLLNYEAATSHSVTVRVTDSGGLTYDKAFTITVTDVNESPIDLSLSATAVAENATTGTVVGIVSGTDLDTGDTKSYSLTDTAGGRFAIHATTGQLTVADGSLLNYETATSHSVTVRVTDSGGLTYDKTFTIAVTDVNEGPTSVENADRLIEDMAHTLSTSMPGIHHTYGAPKTSSSEPQVSRELEESGLILPKTVQNTSELPTVVPAPVETFTTQQIHLSVSSEKPLGTGVDSKETQQPPAQNKKSGSNAPPDQTEIQKPTTIKAGQKEFLEPTDSIENGKESTALKLSATMGVAGVVLQNSLGNTSKLSRLIPRSTSPSNSSHSKTSQKLPVDDHKNRSEQLPSTTENDNQGKP